MAAKTYIAEIIVEENDNDLSETQIGESLHGRQLKFDVEDKESKTGKSEAAVSIWVICRAYPVCCSNCDKYGSVVAHQVK